MIRRLYRCDDCGFQFQEYQDKSDPLLVDCPACAGAKAIQDHARETEENEARMRGILENQTPPAIKTTMTRHRDHALKTAEAMMIESGATDMHSSGRQGDIAAKAPAPVQSAEAEAMTRELVNANAVNESQANEFNAAAKNLFQPGQNGFWQGGPKLAQSGPKMITPRGGAPAVDPMAVAMPRAAANAKQARSEGVDPIALLHKNKQDNRIRMQVEAKVRGA